MIELFKSVLEVFISGGPVMIPILIVSLFIWVLATEKHYQLKAEDRDFDGFTEGVIKLLASGNENQAIKLCEDSPGIISVSVKALLSSKNTGKESLWQSARQVLLEAYPKLEEHISTIGTLASVAPLLGLLGTVCGMVSTFTAIGLYGTGDPEALAKGISEALITTQAGLIVAIPALFFHSHLVKKVDTIGANVEKNLTKLINFFTSSVK